MKFYFGGCSKVSRLNRALSGTRTTKLNVSTERELIMKKLSKAVLMAALGLALVPTVKASSGYDLIAGFTTGSGSDFLIDLGPSVGFGYPGGTPLFDGETWNLSSDISSLSTIQWGVIGDAIGSDGQSPQTLWVTTPGVPATPLPNSDSRFAQVDNPISTIEENDFGGGTPNYVSNQGQMTTVAVGNQNSWDQQTIAGTLSTQFINSYGNPNVTGETSDTLWQVPEGGTPTEVGSFTLDSTGTLTFTAVPEPGTVGLFALGTLSLFVWRNRLSRKNA
jgi:hypothetical protein